MGMNTMLLLRHADIVHAGQSVKPSQLLTFGVLGCFDVSVGRCCTWSGEKLRTD